MRIVIVLILLPFLSIGQHRSVSYELSNEIGTFKLVSLTTTHEADNADGITWVIQKATGDTFYFVNQFLGGWVALSNDGVTIAHLVSEQSGKPLDNSQISFYRFGKPVKSSTLGKLVDAELKQLIALDRLPKSGWARNDSIYHKMASNPFYITEDRVHVSLDGPQLNVFDINQMYRIYNGNGANHFFQNYYAIPNPPYRQYMDDDEFFPEGFPLSKDGTTIEDLIANGIRRRATSSDKASAKAEVVLKLKSDGRFELREASICSVSDNEKSDKESQLLKEVIEQRSFDTSLIPPNHPAWIFETTIWLK